jgi:hypothetical protein
VTGAGVTVERADGAGMFVAGGAPVPAPGTSHATQIPLVPGEADVQPGTVAEHAMSGGVAASLRQGLSVSGAAPVAPISDVPANAESLFEHTVRAVLVPASLFSLAAVALPGLGGLLIVSAAGVRVGYRQAKTGLALRAAGIARFAGPGPLGVVRSGSQIALRTRPPRVRPSPHAAAGRPLGDVA